jgi:hypothetical protein
MANTIHTDITMCAVRTRCPWFPERATAPSSATPRFWMSALNKSFDAEDAWAGLEVYEDEDSESSVFPCAQAKHLTRRLHAEQTGMGEK